MSAWPIPWTAPPSTWPCAMTGLTTRPMSLTDAYETTRTSPVAGSISTSQTWQPFGQVGPSTVVDASTWMRDAACLPASANRSMPRSVPTTEKRASRYSMSDAAKALEAAASDIEYREAHRRATREERARAGAAEAVAAIGVALDDADFLERHAEDVDRQLRVAGLDALPHLLRRREDLDEAVRRHVDAHLLFEGVAAGPFQKRGDAAATQQAARFALAPPRRKAVPVGERQALVENFLEAAAVVGLGQRVLVRHLRRRDHVAAAQLGRVEPELARRRIHQALDDVDRLGPAGAAVGAGRRRVRQHRDHV